MISEKLLAAVDAAKGRSLAARQLAAAAGLHPGEATAAKRVLRELVREGVLVREGKRFRRSGAPAQPAVPAPAETGERPVRGEGRRARGATEVRPPGRGGAGRRTHPDREVVGVLTLRPEGYGFVRRVHGAEGEDVFLPPPECRFTLDGDTVRIEIVPGKYGRDAGRLLEVVERRRRHVVGTYRLVGRDARVEPADPRLPPAIPVPRSRKAADGQAVKVAITSYPGPRQDLEGEVVAVVGAPDDPIVEVLKVAYGAGFTEDFPVRVVKEAERVPDHVLAEEAARRRDLRDLPLVTIDGEDARDFDDAVFVERTRGGYRLVVAIADVAHYVREGSLLDEEALSRATSCYFPNHVLPMLPERLSNGICSLNPEVDRLCMVCEIAFDGRGRPQGSQLHEGVMRSQARCTYAQVARLLGGDEVPELSHVADYLETAGDLAKHLLARRMERGSIDFDLPEAKVVLDAELRPVAVVKRERNVAHRLIEEFMLAANEAVARHFADRGLPTVYRVHGTPDPEKLEAFASLARAQGFPLDVSEGISPRSLNAFLRQLEGSQHQAALNSLLLRAMMQAVYSPENIGHFGLAATHYLHFTSPIRRYPDLMVHRLLKEDLARDRPIGEDEAAHLEERLEEVASISSERERAAMTAERDVDAYFKCVFMKDRVGERFGATVVAVTDFGFFAELDGTAVEGLVRAEELGTSWDLDPRSYRLVFGSGLSFGIGDRVGVEIASVSLERRRIDLVLVEEPAEVAPEPPRRKKRRRGEPALEEAPAFGVLPAGTHPAIPEVGPARPRRTRTPVPAVTEETAPRKRKAGPAERPRTKTGVGATVRGEGGRGGGRDRLKGLVDEVRGGNRRRGKAVAEEPAPRRRLGGEPTAAELPPRRRRGEEAPRGRGEGGGRKGRGAGSRGGGRGEGGRGGKSSGEGRGGKGRGARGSR